jgi:hypothetical protein
MIFTYLNLQNQGPVPLVLSFTAIRISQLRVVDRDRCLKGVCSSRIIYFVVLGFLENSSASLKHDSLRSSAGSEALTML